MSGWDLYTFGELSDYETERPARTISATIQLRLRPELLDCDECGSQADCVHFIGEAADYPRQGVPVLVRFSCRRHDAGGYWLWLSRLTEPDTLSHIAEKSWGLRGLAALDERLEEIDAAAFRTWREAHRAA